MMSLLRAIESWLQSGVEGRAARVRRDLEPLDVVRQVEREIERNKKVFVNDQVYVPHKMVIHLVAPTSQKVEEYETLFNQPEFRTYVEEYIRDHGYRLLDRIRVTIQCHREPTPEFGSSACYLEFSWPLPGSEPGDVTVVIDPKDPRRILRTGVESTGMSPEAWVEVAVGRCYESPVAITRPEFNLGRTRQVVHPETGEVVRVNHLAFTKADSPSDVNRSVSRRHATLLHCKGTYLLIDTGSENRTSVRRGSSTIFVPRDSASSGGVEVRDLDVLLLGDVEVRFHLGRLPGHEPSIADGAT